MILSVTAHSFKAYDAEDPTLAEKSGLYTCERTNRFRRMGRIQVASATQLWLEEFERITYTPPSTSNTMDYLKAQLPNGICLAYRDHPPLSECNPQGTIVLIHGFPQTSYQFRHVLPLLAAKGFRCIAPDYRGAGSSSKPNDSFDKATMAQDMYQLLDFLSVKERVHLLGHDIGGMVAFAFAHQYPERLKSVCWGECPLPGTQTYYRDKQDLQRQVQQFHFIFHQVPDLPEALVKGNERAYITHFYTKIGYKVDALSKDDIDQYAAAYEQPGAMRCAFGLYRSFEKVSKFPRAGASDWTVD